MIRRGLGSICKCVELVMAGVKLAGVGLTVCGVPILYIMMTYQILFMIS